MLLRGDNIRKVEFADFWVLKIDQALDLTDGSSGSSDEHPMSCMIINLMGTKTNSDISKRDYGVALRNRHPTTCVIGALASYLHLRYSRMDWPSFEMNQTWYNTKLISLLDNPKAGVKYGEHNRAIKDLLKKAGIQSTKVTHIGRNGGVGFLGKCVLCRPYGRCR